MKEWKESRVWLYLADRWDRAKPSGGTTFARILGAGAEGICFSLFLLLIKHRIGYATKVNMTIRMNAYAPSSWVGTDMFWWPLDAKGARKRAAFCRKMARLAAKEGK